MIISKLIFNLTITMMVLWTTDEIMAIREIPVSFLHQFLGIALIACIFMISLSDINTLLKISRLEERIIQLQEEGNTNLLKRKL